MTTNATIDTMQPCVQETQWDRDLAAAEAIMPEKFEKRCIMHLMKAMRKHPRFADKLFFECEIYYDAKSELANWRRILNDDNMAGVMSAENLLRCEILEAATAHNARDNAGVISELYDAVAVLMRMIAVVEGKQKLGGEE